MQSQNETVVYDGLDECPYLPGQTARMPLRLPSRMLTGAEFDARLAAGDRRSGPLLYTTHCPQCTACEPIRIAVNRFVPSRSQQRIWRRGQQQFRTVLGEPQVDAERVALFNRHRVERGLCHDGRMSDESDYEQFLVESCCDTREIAYYVADRLMMVAIIDCGATALSAVYTYFDPATSVLGPGVYSVLNEIELCRATGRRYLYLGYYIAASPHMKYKAQYQPHERRVAGEWQAFG